MPHCIMDMFCEPMNYKILKLAKFLKESENCVCVLTSKVAGLFGHKRSCTGEFLRVLS